MQLELNKHKETQILFPNCHILVSWGQSLYDYKTYGKIQIVVSKIVLKFAAPKLDRNRKKKETQY